MVFFQFFDFSEQPVKRLTEKLRANPAFRDLSNDLQLGGSDNATTRNDTTLYFQTLAPHALGVSFEILADRMSTAHLSAAQWLGEREVIKNERSESVDNSHVQRGLEMTLPTPALQQNVAG